MDRLDLVRRMIELGSDALVAGLHERLCVDRLARVSADRRHVPSWEELAAQAVTEQVLAAEEADRLLSGKATPVLPAPGDPVPAQRLAVRRGSASREEEGA